MRSPVRFALVVLVLAWSGGFAWQALGRWSYARWCAKTCGPFVPVELADDFRRAFDWQSPLLLAALPLAALAAWWLARVVTHRRGRLPV